jgi:dTDP-L-rhamnose 4-epimerase
MPMGRSIKNILITGGAGFIGSRLARKLAQKGYVVIILDNLSMQVHGINPEKTSYLYRSILDIPNIKIINGNVTVRSDWERAIEQSDAIVHLAAETGTGQSMYEIEKYTNVNIGGTSLMLDILANVPHGIRRIVIASSRAIYGEGKYHCDLHGEVYPIARKQIDLVKKDFECKCPLCKGGLTLKATDENSLRHPSSIYGITKQAQEDMVMIFGGSMNIETVTLRYQNVYGPGQSLNNPYTGILSIFSTQIKNMNNIDVFEDGLESRDFVYIDDVVDATVLGLERPEAAYKIFNIGSGKLLTVLSVAEMLVKYYESHIKIEVTGNYRLGDIRHNCADISLAEKYLDYHPRTNFIDGIKNFIEWVNSQNIYPDQYRKSIEEMKNKGLFK